MPRGRSDDRPGRGLPKSLPKLRSSQSAEENSEHLTELKTPANNADDLKSTRCKAVYTGSIPVVAFLFACKEPVFSQAKLWAVETAQKAVYTKHP